MALTKVQDGGLNLTDAGMPAGSVLQVESASLADVFSAAIASNGDFSDVTGLSVSITPSSTNSKIFVIASLTLGASNQIRVGARLVRDATVLDDMSNLSSRTGSMLSGMGSDGGTGDNYMRTSGSMATLDSPSSTSSLTYKVQAGCEGGYTVYVGRNGGDADSASVYRVSSSITVMEIAG